VHAAQSQWASILASPRGFLQLETIAKHVEVKWVEWSFGNGAASRPE